MSRSEEVRRRNLSSGIEGAAKARESTDQLQTFGVVEACTTLGNGRPLERERHPDRLPW